MVSDTGDINKQHDPGDPGDESSHTREGPSEVGIRAMQGFDEVAEAEGTDGEVVSDQIEQEAVEEKIGKDTIWDQGSVKRGCDYETVKEANIAGNFPTIDDFDSETGTATSLKTIDLNANSYQDANILSSTVNKYTDKLGNFEGASWGGHVVPGEAVEEKVLEIGIPKDSLSEDQAKVLEDCAAHAKKQNICFVVEEVA